MPSKAKQNTESKSAKVIEITLPYTPEASKNRKWKWRSSKHLSEGYSQFVQDVKNLVIDQTNKKGIVWDLENKRVVVDFTFYRSPKQSRTDTQNFLEPLCDGIKYALRIDDVFYVGSWDWVLTEKEPKFVVRVSQF